MDGSYRTIAKEAGDEFVERRSRFIGAVRPVVTEEEALRFIQEKKKRYWDASHNVSAYILQAGGIRRYSDDGEPQGTAGLPVLDVLQKEGLTDCCVVVTRYFGGILLGGGGLVRAYSHGASLAVAAGGIQIMRLCVCARLTCDYAQYGWTAPLIAECGGTVEDTQYTDRVTMLFHLPQETAERLQAELTERSAGKLVFSTEAVRYFAQSV